MTVGTAMEGTHLPLTVWYLAMYLMLSTAKPISAMSLSRRMGIQYRTCWHLLHRLRAMMASGDPLLTGLVEADETYVGGKARNRQKHREPSETASRFARGKRGRGTDKPMPAKSQRDLREFAAIQRGGSARSLVVPSASSAAIAPALWDWTGGAAMLLTDELATYRWIGRKMEAHHAVNHSSGEYARTEGAARVHSNTVEPRKSLRDFAAFFGLFKMALVGIPHAVSPKHLHRYATEHTFRYNRRGHDAGETRKSPCDFAGIARCLIGRHGRLRLRELFA